MELPFSSLDYSTLDTKKRQHEDVCISRDPSQPQVKRRRRSTKASYGAAHDIRMLRAEVLYLEEELRGQRLKWAKHLPEQRTFLSAVHTAHEKYKTDLSMTLNNSLKDMLVQQQFIFATLQSSIFHSPLFSSGEETLRALHFDTQLGCDPEGRIAALKTHKQRSLEILPSFLRQITRKAVDKTCAANGNTAASKSVLPISRVDVTGC
ncbi:unnamed protein product [Phytophthora fragariaefolia]|uniref:Unnamed protein product n=1 Tax=Phytophthora fragariaefolia TaxID=1490495 RepID=A0A9W6TTT4_9STRA|nr:unnamed protein product [Phytophthora fragariaefolia]